MKPTCPSCMKEKNGIDMYLYNDKNMCRSCVILEMKKRPSPNQRLIEHFEKLEQKYGGSTVEEATG